MSQGADSTQATTSGSSQSLSRGMRLYGASARNVWPRMVASSAVAAVLVQGVGAAWTLGWLAAIWVGLILGIRLVGEFQKPHAPQQEPLVGYEELSVPVGEVQQPQCRKRADRYQQLLHPFRVCAESAVFQNELQKMRSQYWTNSEASELKVASIQFQRG